MSNLFKRFNNNMVSRRKALAAITVTGLTPWLATCGGGGSGSASGGGGASSSSSSSSISSSSSFGAPDPNDALLIEIEQKTFDYFWNSARTDNGLCPDRYPSASPCSIAAVGFGLTAYCIGAERGFITRQAAAQRTVVTLRTFLNGPQGMGASGVIGYKGFFYHFLDMATATRIWTSELSTIDTALFLMGAITAGAYFTGSDAVEVEIRQLANDLYDRVDWSYMVRPSGLIGHGWTPEAGYLSSEWSGFNEAMMVYLLALASTTHPIAANSWDLWAATYAHDFGFYMGQTYLGIGPLFVQQYNQVWFDFRGIADTFMRSKGMDYFENSRRATLAQRQYAITNAQGFTGYGGDMWGFSACDGPADVTLTLNGVSRTFKTYAARGVGLNGGFDDGTLAPTAAISSLPFTPAESFQALSTLKIRYGADILGTYGFFDAFNPTFVTTSPSTTGLQTPNAGWVGNDYLGIDQGPILAMIENYRSGMIWSLLRASPIIKRGLNRAGFTVSDSRGSWLAT